jgi:hypothetical protein
LAKKYRPDAEAEVVSVKAEPLPDSTEKPTVNGNGNGNGVVDDPMGSEDARAQSVDADMAVLSKEADAGAELVGVEPPAKRQKVEERYLSASERIREALKAVEVEL